MFKGNSTIPSAPASFNSQISLRTVFSSTTLSTATQFSSLRVETVGLRRAGRKMCIRDSLYSYYKLDDNGIMEAVTEMLNLEVEEDEDWEDEV